LVNNMMLGIKKWGVRQIWRSSNERQI